MADERVEGLLPPQSDVGKNAVQALVDEAVKKVASNAESSKALSEIINLMVTKKKHVFLTGRAGTGKTTVLTAVVDALIKKASPPGKRVVVSAMTGVAASHIPCVVEARTLHSAIGIKAHETCGKMKGDLSHIMENVINEMGYLIIDEISMLSANLLEEIDKFLRSVRKVQEFMGGIITLFSGDFLQLPPVQIKGDATKFYTFQSRLFETHVRPNTVYLKTPHRQLYDDANGEFNEILQQVRINSMTEDTLKKLKSRDMYNFTEKLAKQDVKPMRLYGKNEQADKYNTDQLSYLKGPQNCYVATHYLVEGKDNRTGAKKLPGSVPNGAALQESAANLFNETTLIPPVLNLKVGALVMYLVNNPQLGICNGSRGIMTEFMEKSRFPVVQFQNTKKVVIQKSLVVRMMNDSDGHVVAVGRNQIPLKLAWALTIHKSQGLTFNGVIIDCEGIFTYNQFYVALSRAKQFEDVYLLNFSPKCVRVNGAVLAFYALFDQDIKEHCIRNLIPLKYPFFGDTEDNSDDDMDGGCDDGDDSDEEKPNWREWKKPHLGMSVLTSAIQTSGFGVDKGYPGFGGDKGPVG